MPRGERLFRSVARLVLDRFYGNVTIRFEAGKVTRVTTETQRTWEYHDLPEPVPESTGEALESSPSDQHGGT